MLKSIQIKGYRSIRDASLELRKLNVLIGANGAGKSNFISFFKMLNEMMAGRLQQYIAATGRATSLLHFGPKVTMQLESRIEFELANGARDWYHMRMFHAPAGDTLGFADETLEFHKSGFAASTSSSLGAGHHETRIGEKAQAGDQTAKIFQVILNRCRVYHFHDTSLNARARAACYVHDNRWLMPDAGNLAAMLYVYRQRYPAAYRRIVSTLCKILPDFDDFDVEPTRLNPDEVILNWRLKDRDYLLGPHQLSDGTLRAIAIMTLFLQPQDNLPDVIIIDEPELGLHPSALEIVAGLMRAASHRTQVIVATQSLSFLNHFEPDEIVVVESHQGASAFRRLDSNELRDWLEDYSIGELWQRNVIGGGPLP